MSHPSRLYLLAVFFKVLYVSISVVMFSLVRIVNDIPLTEVMFFRSFFAIIPVGIWLLLRNEARGAFRTSRPFANVKRAILGLTSTILAFMAVQNLPLADAITLQYSQPLFVVAFSAMFLSERVGVFRWGAVIFGFLGVLVVTWPRLTLLSGGLSGLRQGEVIGIGAALAASATIAVVLLVIRDLVRTEKPTTITLYSWLVTSSLLALTASNGWVPLTMLETVILIACGILGGLVQLLMAVSLKFAPASATASFEYTSLILAMTIGYYVFGDAVNLSTLFGGLMVIVSGLAIIWRENRCRLEDEDGIKIMSRG